MINYSEDVKIDQRRKLNNIKRQIQLSNLRAKAIQDLDNGVTKPDTMDTRSYLDIENDEFERQALFNEYSRKLLGNGDISKFQQDIKDDGYLLFFLNNFPLIEKEISKYRIKSADNLFNVVKKAYNREIKELELIDDKGYYNQQTSDALGLLKEISLNYKDLSIVSGNNVQRQLFGDKKNKVDALITAVEHVGDQVSLLQDIFKASYMDIKANLQQTANTTTPPNDPNANIAQIAQTPSIFDTIDKSTLSQGIANYSKLNYVENSASSTTSTIQPDSLLQTPIKSGGDTNINQTPELGNNSNMESKDNTTNLGLHIEYDLMKILNNVDEVDAIEIMSNEDRFTKKFLSEYFGKLLHGYDSTTAKDFLIDSTKQKMFKHFKERLDYVRNKLISEEQQKKSQSNEIMRQDTERRKSELETSTRLENERINKINEITRDINDSQNRIRENNLLLDKIDIDYAEYEHAIEFINEQILKFNDSSKNDITRELAYVEFCKNVKIKASKRTTNTKNTEMTKYKNDYIKIQNDLIDEEDKIKQANNEITKHLNNLNTRLNELRK